MIQRDKKIILGSASPRRQSLLSAMGFEFDVRVIPSDEHCDGSISAEELARCVAEKKANLFPLTEFDNDTILITADTVVAINGVIIGKPDNREEAVAMLRGLSGKEHIVYTGVCIKAIEKYVAFCEATKVWFSVLSEEDIVFYVENYKPYDKAGSYGIQEWIGLIGVEKIEGSYFNIMGLPTYRLYKELQHFF